MNVDPLNNEEFVMNEAIIKIEDWGKPEMKEYHKAYQFITKPLEEKFGTAKHFVMSRWDGKMDWGNTKSETFKNSVWGTLSRLLSQKSIELPMI